MTAKFYQNPTAGLARYFPALPVQGCYKANPEDFGVAERLDFELTGSGEHFWIKVEKIDLTTAQLIDEVAKHCSLSRRQIGYAGLKDRQGVTAQWLSLPLAQSRLSEQAIMDVLTTQGDRFRVLAASRHQKKCRIGCHAANDFTLILRHISGSDRSALVARLSVIAKQGFPNYFTEQRFGRDQDNVTRLMAIPVNRSPKKVPGILLSAGRSLLFNQLLSVAITEGVLDRTDVGDVMQLAGSMSYFTVEETERLRVAARRLDRDVSKAFPMLGADQWGDWSRHSALADSAYQAVGEQVARFADKTQYRPAMVFPENWRADWLDGETLHLQFTLPKGAYATALLRELGELTDASRPPL